MPEVKHMVLLRLKPSTTKEEIAEIFEGLDDLVGKIPGLVDVCGGPYSSPEGLHKGFTHGFVMTFTDPESRDVYLTHPDHEVVKEKIVACLAAGLGDVIAFDFDVCDRFRY